MTLDRAATEEMGRPVESVEQLVEALRRGEKPPERWRVGTEHEKLALRAGSFEPVPYDGDAGIEGLLRRMAEVDDWKPLLEAGRVIGLDRGGCGVSLEPGGQVELNGAPLRGVDETCVEFTQHLRRLREVAEPLGIVFLGLGAHPFHPVERMPRVPRERYRIMRTYLPQRGALALEMMHSTASVQVSLDYSDEDDMVEKFRVALAVTPAVAALYANSSLAEGRPSGFVSRRLHVWKHTDPDRTGFLPFVFEPDFGYRRYVEWALDVPMFFVVRDGVYRSLAGKTFRRFLREGHEGLRATLGDFDRHLTTLFPHVRLKQILEVRCVDAIPPALLCSVPALWKGLLYDAQARFQALRRVGEMEPGVLETLIDEVARSGLRARGPTGPLLEVGWDLVAIAREGLRRFTDPGSTRDEASFLDPLEEQLGTGRSPGEWVLEQWDGAWKRSPDRLMEYARY